MEKTNRRKTLALISIMLGAFISLLDTTIVNVALPDITVALHATSQSIEWIISGYALAFGVVLILAGRLGDRFGRKNLYIFGILLFLIMSITAGYAQSEESLIISRVIQGLGAGLFFPQINAVIMDMYSGKHLGKIFGILGSVIGVGTAVGPLAGGLLIELFGADNGWRAVFFVNVPIVLVTLVLAMLYLPKHQAPKEKVRFDIPGVLGLTLALMMLLYPVISRGSNGFRLVDYIWMASSIPVFLLLYWWSVRQAKRGNQPLISPNLLKNQPFVSGMVLSLVYFAAFTSIFFILSVTWQTGFGQSAISSGLAITPFAIGSVLAAANSNRFIMKIGRKLLHLGVVLVIIGLSGVSLVFHLHDGVFSAWWMALPLLTAGIGSGLIIAPLNSFTLSTVVGPERGGASGMFNTAQRIGSSFGIAVVGSVFFRTLDNTTAHSQANAFSDSLQMSMYVNIALLVVCFVLVFRLPRKI